MELVTLKPKELMQALIGAIKARIPVMIWGSPGIGKSDIVRQASTQLDMLCDDRFRGSHVLPEDLKFPHVRPASGKGDASIDWLIGNPFREAQDNGLPITLFLDELPAAIPSVQAVFYQLLGDRRFPNGELMGNHIALVAAGNRESDAAVSYKMPTALKGRLLHLNLTVHPPDWSDPSGWAVSNGINPIVIGFIRRRPDLLYQFSRDDQAYPTPRNWARLSTILPFALPQAGQIQHALFAGCVGVAAAIEFSAFLRAYQSMPDMASLIANPLTAPVSTDPGILYAVSCALASVADRKTFAPILQYIARIPAEYGVLCVQDAITRTSGSKEPLTSTKAYVDWAVRNKDVVMGTF